MTMKGTKTISLLIDTADDVQHKATLADLNQFIGEATSMSNADFPQVFLSVERDLGRTFVVASYEMFPS